MPSIVWNRHPEEAYQNPYEYGAQKQFVATVLLDKRDLLPILFLQLVSAFQHTAKVMQARLPVQIFAAAFLANSAWADLINIDFGADSRFPSQNKSGLAATGVSANDYWNFYSSDNSDTSWKVNGSLADLKYASGAPSKVGLKVYHGEGAWAYANPDAMMENYIYSLGSAQTTLRIIGLPPGTYKFFLYGPDTRFNLTVGRRDYGTKVVFDHPPAKNSPPWEEGKQYALFTNVTVSGSESVNIHLGPGQRYSQGTVSGMQIEFERPCDSSASAARVAAPIAPVAAPILARNSRDVMGFTRPPKLGAHLEQSPRVQKLKPLGDFWLPGEFENLRKEKKQEPQDRYLP